MRLEVREVTGALARPVGNARQRWSLRRSWVITLTDEEGWRGQGECSPLPGYSTETEDEVTRALAALNNGGALAAGEEPTELPPSVACGLRMASLDLRGRRRGRAAATLMCRKPRKQVPIAALLHAEPGPGLLEEAEARVAEGYRTLKWKLGRPGAWDEELASLGALRSQLPDIALRADCNQSWTRAEAEARLPRLAGLNLSLVEEPCPPPYPPSPVPLGADESLRGDLPLDALGPISALVLKPMALGPRRCWELAKQAELRGLGVLVTHLFDGPLALAFGLELARALPGELWACGLAPHLGLSLWRWERIPAISGGWGRAGGHGLGLPGHEDR